MGQALMPYSEYSISMLSLHIPEWDRTRLIASAVALHSPQGKAEFGLGQLFRGGHNGLGV